MTPAMLHVYFKVFQAPLSSWQLRFPMKSLNPKETQEKITRRNTSQSQNNSGTEQSCLQCSRPDIHRVTLLPPPKISTASL